MVFFLLLRKSHATRLCSCQTAFSWWKVAFCCPKSITPVTKPPWDNSPPEHVAGRGPGCSPLGWAEPRTQSDRGGRTAFQESPMMPKKGGWLQATWATNAHAVLQALFKDAVVSSKGDPARRPPASPARQQLPTGPALTSGMIQGPNNWPGSKRREAGREGRCEWGLWNRGIHFEESLFPHICWALHIIDAQGREQQQTHRFSNSMCRLSECAKLSLQEREGNTQRHGRALREATKHSGKCKPPPSAVPRNNKIILKIGKASKSVLKWTRFCLAFTKDPWLPQWQESPQIAPICRTGLLLQ